ncbi:hypothetical protein HYT02_05455 [Candidatus Gottesmanbacteria bacterium]|nr:hypothetical protein [Candidatus Gottesmanbacteria bacterium]
MSDASSLLTGISITAAFVGGMVALFAPCCITFLFPAYLGTIFKEKGRVVFLTLVFGLGMGSILIPVALGFRAVVNLFNTYHSTIYLLGALVMVLLGLATLFEAKINLPFIPKYQMPQKMTVTSTFVLGIFSGITSSCCAPVLFAAITLTSLSPSLLTAVIVSVVYVLGIIFPLFFLSLVYEKLTQKRLFTLKTKINKPLKVLAGGIFILSGILIAYFTLTGKIVMTSQNEVFANKLRTFMYSISSSFGSSIIDIGAFLLIVVVSIVFIRKAIYEEKNSN